MNHFTPLVFAYMLIVDCGKEENPCIHIARNTEVQVPDCPRDKDQYEKRKRLKQCERWTALCNKATYHCVVNPYMNGTIETCAPPANIIGAKCAEINNGERPIQGSGHERAKCQKCPGFYLSTDAYKYHSCYDAVKKKKKDEDVEMETTSDYLHVLWLVPGFVIVAAVIFIFTCRMKSKAKTKALASDEERMPIACEESQAEIRNDGEAIQRDGGIDTCNEGRHTDPIVSVSVEDEVIPNGYTESPEECQPKTTVQVKQKSELKPLLGKQQVKIGRRRNMSESDADSDKSRRKKRDGRVQFLDSQANDVHTNEEQMAGSVNLALLEDNGKELINSTGNNESWRKDDIVRKGRTRIRCKSESDAQNMESDRLKSNAFPGIRETTQTCA